MAAVTLEERVALLEAEMARFKAREQSNLRNGVVGRTNPELIEKMFGIFAGDADAEEVERAISDERQKERKTASLGARSGL